MAAVRFRPREEPRVPRLPARAGLRAREVERPRPRPARKDPLIAGVLATLAVLAVAAPPSPATDAASASTAEMAALLKERAALVNPLALSLVVNDRRADLISRQLTRPLPLGERLRLRGAAVVELINAGRIDDALEALKTLGTDARENDPQGWRQYQTGA